jgi:hypothetical protein
MGIISEIHGDVDMAIQWAQKAYEKFHRFDYRVSSCTKSEVVP